MRLTVGQIMSRVASTVNQEATAPASSGSEFSLWLEYLNRAVHEWSEANDWESLRKTYFPTLIGTSNVTVSLPHDFKKLAGPVRVHNSGDIEGGTEYPDILDEQRGEYSQEDKYVRIMGDISNGMNVIFHAASLTSGASIEIPYFSMPTSLASSTQIPIVPDSQFLVDRTIAYVFEARSDARFQLMEAKARERLLTMIENTNLAKYSSYDNPNYVEVTPLRKAGFRVGRD